MPIYFGTDGIRGKPGEFPLDPSTLYWIGYTLSQLLGSFFDDVKIIIGRDTRESSPLMEKPLCKGIIDGGGVPLITGILPTSALSSSFTPFQSNIFIPFSSAGL